ncbi:hypothetical protein QYF61_011628 [Mycteria americana]|uniref:Uncharacterized protein n=1 Tax=Mycteria americana TaxID=33587 RepID=A0AAN7S399_MYCAM|nr:hypothetical protein QYF61_011628 [Mycteria americana]
MSSYPQVCKEHKKTTASPGIRHPHVDLRRCSSCKMQPVALYRSCWLGPRDTHGLGSSLLTAEFNAVQFSFQMSLPEHLGLNTKLTMRQQCVLVVEKRSVASGSREVILALCSVLIRPDLECWVQFWASQYKKVKESPAKGHEHDERTHHHVLL